MAKKNLKSKINILINIQCQNCHSNLKNKLFSVSQDQRNMPKITFFQCSECQLIQIAPIELKDKEILYSFEDAEKHLLSKNPQVYFLYKLPFGKILHNAYLHWYSANRKKEVEKFKKAGSLLDVGCGNGSFLKEFNSKKWKLFGIEINENQAEKARKLKRTKIFTTRVENFKYPTNSFDVVTLWHVFEHLDDPQKTLNKLNSILKNEGYMLIEVPNGNSIYRKIFGVHWQLLMVPEHLFFWSKKALSQILKKSGFRVVKVSNLGILPFSPISSFANYLRANGVDSNLAIAIAILGFPIFLVINLISLNSRDNLYIVAQKTEAT